MNPAELTLETNLCGVHRREPEEACVVCRLCARVLGLEATLAIERSKINEENISFDQMKACFVEAIAAVARKRRE